MELSLSGNARKIAAGHICKIAAKTILRCGWTAVIMLCLGLYMLFPGSKAARQLYTEKQIPFELIASTNSTEINLDTLSQIVGVERVSPILQMNCQLTFGEKTVSCQIDAVYSAYLDVNLTDGALFTDSTNMPYLVLNEAAAKLFSEKGSDLPMAVQEEILLKSGDVETKAQICGIYQDELETPQIYMGYEVARKLFGAQFTGTTIALRLVNKGVVEKAAASLRKQRLSASVDTDTSLAWNLLEQQTWQTFLVSAVFVACSAILAREKLLQERQSTSGEWETLLMAGLTIYDVKKIIPLRILIMDAMIMCGVMIIAAVNGGFDVIAVVSELICILLHYCVCLR